MPTLCYGSSRKLKTPCVKNVSCSQTYRRRIALTWYRRTAVRRWSDVTMLLAWGLPYGGRYWIHSQSLYSLASSLMLPTVCISNLQVTVDNFFTVIYKLCGRRGCGRHGIPPPACNNPTAQTFIAGHSACTNRLPSLKFTFSFSIIRPGELDLWPFGLELGAHYYVHVRWATFPLM